MIDNKIALLTIVSTIATGLIALIIETYADNNAFAKKYKASTVEQFNACGNHKFLTNITCSTFGLTTEEHENINNMTTQFV